MPARGNTKLDMLAFLEQQRRERYRAFFLHGPPGQGKTTFARSLARAVDGACLDVLGHVAGSTELSAKVDLLDAAFLKSLALDAASRGAGVVLVDEFDFLLPVWGGDLSELVEIVRKLSVTETESVVGFVMRTVPTLEQLSLEAPSGRSRVLALDEMRAIK